MMNIIIAVVYFQIINITRIKNENIITTVFFFFFFEVLCSVYVFLLLSLFYNGCARYTR